MSKKENPTANKDWDNIETQPSNPAAADHLKADNAADTADDIVAKLQADMQQAQQMIDDYKEQVLRLQAEMTNQRSRMERETTKSRQFALESFAKSLLPVVDSLDRSLVSTDTDNAALTQFHEGIQLTMDLFLKTLSKHGIEQIDPTGETFNPDHHEAVSMINQPGAKPNTVIEVLDKGYSLNGRLLRPARVVVAAAA